MAELVGGGQPGMPKRLFQNFSMLFLGNVTGQLLFLVGMIHLARSVGPIAFGVWNLAQAWMLYLFRAGEMGLEVIGIRTIASVPRARMRSIVWNVLVLRVFLACVLFGGMALAVSSGMFPEGSERLVLIFSFAVFPVGVVLEWVFEAHQSVMTVALSRILKGAMFGFPVLFFIHSGTQLEEAAWIYVGSLVLPAALVLALAFSRFSLRMPAFDRRGSLDLLQASIPVGAATILSQYTLLIGTVMAGYLASQEDLGYYTGGHRLVMFLWAYGIVTSNRVILPQLAKLFESSLDRFAEFVLAYYRVLVLAALAIGLCGVAGGGEVIRLLYGNTYDASTPVFQILSIALALAMIRSVLEIGLIAAHRQKVFMAGMVGLAVAYTFLTLAGLLWAGIVGAAWAAVLSEGLYAAFLMKVSGIIPMKRFISTLARPVVASVVALSTLMVADFRSLVLIVVIGLSTYVGMLVLTGELTRVDLRHFGALFGLRESRA